MATRQKNDRSWNQNILANLDGGNIFQSEEFAQQKARAGWAIRRLELGDTAVTVLEKYIFGLGKLWYAPKGPGVSTVDQLQALLPELRCEAKKYHVFTVKIEPEIEKTDKNIASLHSLDFVPTRPIQPNNNTVYIDLSPSVDNILMGLNQKGRHAIRRAERDGVTVEQAPATDENCRTMYDLLATTAADAKFGIRPYDYYLGFWQQFEAAGYGQLFFTYFDGDIVAGAYAVTYGTKSTYKDGASTRQRTAYGASHLLQWYVMQWAKKHGSLVHDLCGAPSIEEAKNPDHPYYGIGRFKTSFNKHITEYVGAWQLPIGQWRSKLWTAGLEKLIRKIYYKIHHQSFY